MLPAAVQMPCEAVYCCFAASHAAKEEPIQEFTGKIFTALPQACPISAFRIF
jgi:hypothetical protein